MRSATDHQTFRARFNPLIKPYLVLYGAAVMAMTLVLLPLAVVWVCGIGQWWASHYFEKLECELGPKMLRFRKGILFQVEKSIPLENIQDVTFIEGPILRQFNLSTIKFETAGQSMGQAHDMTLVGIIDAEAFRTRILEARELLRSGAMQPRVQSAIENEQIVLLRNIKERLDDIANLLRNRKP
ncbi:MAG: PH domain-containing protein [Ahniella sp.]|nr:PH domain-containing protein [Ahniella sp.]